MVSPTLHHCAALIEVFGAIVRSAHGVLLLVSKLALDYVWAKSHFIERAGGLCPKAVHCRATMIAHAIQRIEHGVVAHVPFARRRGKKAAARDAAAMTEGCRLGLDVARGLVTCNHHGPH